MLHNASCTVNKACCPVELHKVSFIIQTLLYYAKPVVLYTACCTMPSVLHCADERRGVARAEREVSTSRHGQDHALSGRLSGVTLAEMDHAASTT